MPKLGIASVGFRLSFLGAHQEKYINGNDSKETDFWMNLGRNRLKKEFAAKLDRDWVTK